MRIIRWLIYIVLTILVLGLIERGFWWLIETAYGWEISIFWLVILFPLFCGIVYGASFGVIFLITATMVKISPDAQIGGKIFAGISVLIFLFLLYKVWQLPYAFTSYAIVFCILSSILIIQFGGFVCAQAIEIGDGKF